MPYRKQQFVNGEIYHVVARRIEDNLLFKNIDDYYRGIFSVYEFNTNRSVTIRERRAARVRIKADRDPAPVTDNRELLVEILAFCLMPNHIHLLLKQVQDRGISKFMQKFGAGYAAYFKNKYELKNKGHFFQERFVAVRIKTDKQLKTIFVYIHVNPISFIRPGWKEAGIQNPDKVIEFVENYKWSSYPDYIGKQNFPSVTKRDFLLEIMGGAQGCKDFIENWIRYKAGVKEFAGLVIE